MDAITAESRSGARAPGRSDAHVAALVAIGGVVTTVAHEIRNILGSLELYASLLAEEAVAVSPDLSRLSGRVLAGVKQLGAVSGDLLAISRRAGIEAQPLDLRHVVQDTLASLRLTVAGTGVRLRLSLPRDKAWIAGDAERLRQALLNLALNGLQAIGDAGVLTVTVRAQGDAVTLSVRDTGHGMDAATLARATEPFFSTRPNGTGLGLAVVREVAEAHGARLAITSRPGAGTTVRLTFPLCERTWAAEPAVQETADARLR
jgi:signal transduction histidine kinase